MMGKTKLRCFWVTFHSLIWLVFGTNVFLATLFTQIVMIPGLFIFSRTFRSNCIYMPLLAYPFVRHHKPKSHGLEGARNFDIRFESNFDNCTIDLGVWHALPKSLVNKHEALLDRGNREEINRVFDDELKNSGHPVFLYFHGVSGSRASSYRVELYKLLQSFDAHVVTFDFRGFGDSTCVFPTKIGEVEDGLIVYSWIRSLIGKDRPVHIWGHSMGSSIVQRAFSKLKPYSFTLLRLKELLPPPQKMVIEGGFNSTVDLTGDFIAAKILNWIPFIERLFLNTMRTSETLVAPEDYAGRLKEHPMLILHSKDDMVNAYKYGEKLYEKHVEVRKDGGAPVTFKSFETEGHFNIYKHPDLPLILEEFLQMSRI